MSTDREKEYDLLEQELRAPFVHKPDKMNVADGAMCWINDQRMCGPDCKAFNVLGVGIDDADVAVQAHMECVLLAAATSQATGMVQLVVSNRKLIDSLEDKKRAAAYAPPPSPYGPKP